GARTACGNPSACVWREARRYVHTCRRRHAAPARQPSTDHAVDPPALHRTVVPRLSNSVSSRGRRPRASTLTHRLTPGKEHPDTTTTRRASGTHALPGFRHAAVHPHEVVQIAGHLDVEDFGGGTGRVQDAVHD